MRGRKKSSGFSTSDVFLKVEYGLCHQNLSEMSTMMWKKLKVVPVVERAEGHA